MGDTYYRTLLELSPTAVVAIDGAGTIRLLNDRATHLLGSEAAVGQGFAELFTPDDAERVTGYLVGLAAAPSRTVAFFTGVLASGGAPERFLHVHGRSLLDHPDAPVLLLTVLDGTAARRRESELESMALYDTLTGLANRTLFQERVARLSELGGPLGAVVMVDLDNFKQVNDSLGHETGDVLLVEVARRLERVFPESATIARLGGDEFAVLLPGVAVDVAGKLADRACDEIAAPYPGIDRAVGASIGVSRVHHAGRSLREADVAMYAAKVQGRGRAVRYQPGLEELAHGLVTDVAQVVALREERDRLHLEARTDALTGLPNRRALDEYLAGGPGIEAAALLFVDLDRFGLFNKAHTDQRGDEVLREVGNALVTSCRGADVVFRKGGEEFVAVLPGTLPEDAVAAGERFRRAVEDLDIAHGAADDVPVVSVTVGVAHARDQDDLEAALVRAGAAAYAAKVADRRNSVTLADPA